jgi:NTE family protein
MTNKYSSNHNNKSDKQRALVLQGGGALGAYEVGVIKGLYEKLTQQDEGNSLKDNRTPLFDVITGTSIGAMNAAVLVGNVIKKKSWKDAIDELEKFWVQGLASSDIPPPEMFPTFPWWRPWKEKWHEKIDGVAIEEAARRYYSTKYFVFGGKKVFSPKEIRPDYKFFDQADIAKWLVLNDEPLQKQIEVFGAFPIKSSFDKGEPRLLVTAVDIAEGITVTFDSYKKADGKRKTVYYSGGKYGHKKDSKQIAIEYENGITIEHVMASGTIPELFEPKAICKDPNNEICKRKFWDGGLLSNTPIRELLEAHRDYWVNVENKEEAPDLEVYIINVHPSTIDLNNIPKYYDEVKDRNNDILYGDRTYDQCDSSLITDYIDIIKDLKQH